MQLAVKVSHPTLLAAAAAVLTSAFSAVAQPLPAPSRTVYKCEVRGKVTYSDEPCLGAQKLDVEPTRGLNASSGRERVGTDVRRERDREAIAEALRPITGVDAKGLDQRGRRMKLTAEAQRECGNLDGAIPTAEKKERAASKEGLAQAQVELYTLRRRYADLRCE